MRSRYQMRFLAIGLTTALTLAGCGPSESDGAASSPSERSVVDATVPTPAYTDITPQEMVEVLRDGDYLVINVHVPFEGEIPGTDVHIPFDQIEDHLADLPADKDAGILLYCRSGSMSRTAAATLTSLGYTNLLHLDGGMIAWDQAGYPLAGREGL